MDLVIIGFGELGKAFYKTSKQTEKIRIVGYHDVKESNLHPTMQFFPSLKALLDIAVDGYILTAPQDKQVDIALALAETGRKIIIPLPLSTSLGGLETLIGAIPHDQLVIAPLSCYQKNIRALKKHLELKILGTVGIAEFSHVVSERPQQWYQDLSIGGGCRYQLLLPLLCEVLYLFGDIEASFGHYACSETSDYANCSLKLTSGMLVSLETNWGSKETSRKTIELSGERGNISLDSRESNPASLASDATQDKYWDASSEGTSYNPIKLFYEDIAVNAHLITPANLLKLQGVIETCEMVSEAIHA